MVKIFVMECAGFFLIADVIRPHVIGPRNINLTNAKSNSTEFETVNVTKKLILWVLKSHYMVKISLSPEFFCLRFSEILKQCDNITLETILIVVQIYCNYVTKHGLLGCWVTEIMLDFARQGLLFNFSSITCVHMSCECTSRIGHVGFQPL